MLIEKVKSQLRDDRDIENILEKYDWEKFENVTAEIFRENDFCTKQNFRFKTKRRYEIDVLASRKDTVFCVDCKWWGRGRYKKFGIKYAIINQKNRVKELQKFLKKNPIARSMLGINQNYAIGPLVVTLHEEDMIKENDTFVIPAWKLNTFLSDV